MKQGGAYKRERLALARAVRVHAAESRVFPWRKTVDPYRILVSEIMLQQTQTERVVPKYRAFLKAFPTVRALAAAPLAAVLRAWSGLGYNRRAKMLHAAARAIVAEHGGAVPKTFAELHALPGVGPYTAGAVLAFAHNIPHPIIETNIRTVYLHHFFKGKHGVTDAEILALVDATLDRTNPRRFYTALMDYGATLKRSMGNLNVRSKSYTKQSAFKGSARQLRGVLIRALGERPMGARALARIATVPVPQVEAQLAALAREGLVRKRARTWGLVD